MITIITKFPKTQLILKQINSLVSQRPSLTIRFETPNTPLPASVVSILNKWLEKLQNVFRRIAEDSITLSSLAPNLKKTASMIQYTTKKQKEKSNEILSESRNLSIATADIQSYTKNAVNHSKDIVSLSAEAKAFGQLSIEQTQTVKQVVEQMVQMMTHLEKESKKIENITDWINDIASRTRVLSINASIEAVQAGDAGRGFSVIAKEVRILSGNIMDATEKIQVGIGDLLNQIQNTLGYVNQVETAVTQSHHVINQADISLKKVTHHQSILHESLNNIADAISIQNTSIDQIVDKITDISKLTEEESGEEEHLLQVVDTLNRHCDGLLMEIGTFRLQQHENAKTLALEIAAHPDIKNGQRARKESRLQFIADRNPWIELLYITDAHGRQIVRNISNRAIDTTYHTDGYGENWQEREWFTEVKKTEKVFISDLYRSKATDDFCFTISTPIRDQSDSLNGVLAIDVNFSQMVSN